MKIILAVDDLDAAQGRQTPADLTRRLVIDGREYEIDLTEAHSKELDNLLAVYVDAASHSTAVRSGGKRGPDAPGARDYRVKLRAFADGNGFKYQSDAGHPSYSMTLIAAADAAGITPPPGSADRKRLDAHKAGVARGDSRVNRG